MYTITVRGLAGPEVDIVAARLYLDSGAAVEVAAKPGAQFTATLQHPTNGTLPLAYSFVDSAGNESARRTQPLFIPDKEAPTMPADALQLVSVVWA